MQHTRAEWFRRRILALLSPQGLFGWALSFFSQTYKGFGLWRDAQIAADAVGKRIGIAMPELNAALFVGVAVLLYVIINPPRPGLEFYESRKEMNAWRGDIDVETRRASTVWAAWITGRTATAKHEFPWSKVKRLILPSPECKQLPEIAGELEFDLATVKRDIIEATKKARRYGTDVVWHTTLFEPMFIANPTAHIRAWARVESLGSRLVTNYVVPKWRRGRLFRMICDRYEQVFRESDPAPEDIH